MIVRRIAIALLFCVAAAAPSRAGEQTDQLVAAFAKVCLAKPQSMSALNKVAMAQGFALDQGGAASLADAENNRADPFNLLLFWTFGADKNRMRLTGLIDGKIDRYELGCIVDGYDVPPQEVLAALKTILGEPTARPAKENNWIEFAWATSGDARRTVTLSYNEARPQRVSLTLVQFLGASAAKPQ